MHKMNIFRKKCKTSASTCIYVLYMENSSIHNALLHLNVLILKRKNIALIIIPTSTIVFIKKSTFYGATSPKALKISYHIRPHPDLTFLRHFFSELFLYLIYASVL